MRYLALLLTVFPSIAAAQGAAKESGFVPLEPLPFLPPGAVGNFTETINALFTGSLILGAAVTAVMLTYGGIQYMTSNATGKVEEGRSRIKNALMGFFLLLAVYLIAFTISPNLLKVDLNLANVGREYAETATDINGRLVPDSARQPGGRCDPALFNGVLPQECVDAKTRRVQGDNGQVLTVSSRDSAQKIKDFRAACKAAGGVELRSGGGVTEVTFICVK